MRSIPLSDSFVPRAVGARGLLAAVVAFLLALGALVVGLAPDSVSGKAAASLQSFVHTHPDGSVWWHDPSTGEARNLTSASPPPAPTAGAAFSFGAAGDFGFSGDAQSVMSAMGSAGVDFAIVLGDFSYGETSEANWCNFFESKMGDGRVVLIVGNHDTGWGQGSIDVFRQHCNFGIDALLTGDYAKEFYFDYPRADPLARFILTGCGTLPYDAAAWPCVPGDPHYAFVSDAIDDARSAGIPWVIVGMHKNCISNGQTGCEIGDALQDLLLAKADLVLQGHDHNYQRSKQLACADDNVYRPECVVDADHVHDHGVGGVVNIAGTGGRVLFGTGGRPDEPYFRTWASSTKGFLRIDVSVGAIDVVFRNVIGGYTDSYRIVRGPPSPDFALSTNPASVTFPVRGSATTTVAVQSTGGFAGRVDLTTSSNPSGVSTSCVPSGVTGSGSSTCTMTSSLAGSYTVTITGTSGSLVRSTTLSVAVTLAGPMARFTFSPSLPGIGDVVSFDATSSTDTDPDATLEARWDWEGDGTWDTPHSATLTAQHSFSDSETYLATLEVRDSNGFTDTESRPITVVDLSAGEVGAPPGYGLTDPTKVQARGPIYIGSNADFNAANGVRRGSGTPSDPYVISDWLIDGSLYPSTQAMIHLEYTDAYVVIENNKIINLAGSNHWEAIQLGHWPAIVDTQHVTIRHNHIANARHAYGISAREGSRDVRIEANYVRLDANYDRVYGIATDRNVHDVTIVGNYVDAFTSGTFHTSGIHVGDTHIDDSRRATGVVVTRNTVVNATASAIVSESSTGTLIGWNLLYGDPGTQSVSAGYPRGIDTLWNSDDSVVVGNVIHGFESGVLVGSERVRIVSNTIHDVDYGIFVPDPGSMPGVSSAGGAVYNTTMWDVTAQAVRLPAQFQGTVVDVGPGVRPTDLTPVTLVTHGPATRITYAWSGTRLDLSALVGGVLASDSSDTAGSQTLSASWAGSIIDLDVSAFSPGTIRFRLMSSEEVAFEGSGFLPTTMYNLIRSNSGGTSVIQTLASTSTGALEFTIPQADDSTYHLAPEAGPDSGAPVDFPDLFRVLPLAFAALVTGSLFVTVFLLRRRRRKRFAAKTNAFLRGSADEGTGD